MLCNEFLNISFRLTDGVNCKTIINIKFYNEFLIDGAPMVVVKFLILKFHILAEHYARHK